MRLLLLEDDEALAVSIATAFRNIFIDVEWEGTGLGAMRALREGVFDILVLDLNLPDVDGIEVLRYVRKLETALPVLILSAREGLTDRVAGLDLGADDYVTKPFDLPELEARVRALLRRANPVSQPDLLVGKMRLDLLSQRVYVDSESIELAAREFAILEILMNHAGHAVSKEWLLGRISGEADEIGVNALEVCVHRLRKKIIGSEVELRTIRGLGYILEET